MPVRGAELLGLLWSRAAVAGLIGHPKTEMSRQSPLLLAVAPPGAGTSTELVYATKWIAGSSSKSYLFFDAVEVWQESHEANAALDNFKSLVAPAHSDAPGMAFVFLARCETGALMRANPFEGQLERLARTLTEQFGVQVICRGGAHGKGES